MGFALLHMIAALAHVRGHLRAILPVAGRALPLQRAGGFRRMHAAANEQATRTKASGEGMLSETQENVFAQRLAKVQEMREENVEPFAYAPTHRCEALQREYTALGAGE
ncbi:hypothetical protein T492DRAFT_875121, partial [Pavlovales sp. CCMP2436]